jgi:hypothetical protein
MRGLQKSKFTKDSFQIIEISGEWNFRLIHLDISDLKFIQTKDRKKNIRLFLYIILKCLNIRIIKLKINYKKIKIIKSDRSG